MGSAIPITRLDRTASGLRSFASKCGDGAQVRRLLAIALVLDGHSRAEAAEKMAWTDKRRVTECIATMRPGSTA